MTPLQKPHLSEEALGDLYDKFRKAISEGQTHRIKHLLKLGADANWQFWGLPALQIAAFDGETETVKTLLGAGADVDALTVHGQQTALHSALMPEGTGVLELLICAGADVNAKNRLGETPLHEAAFRDRCDAARLLIAAGARWDLETKLLPTALEVGIKRGADWALEIEARRKCELSDS